MQAQQHIPAKITTAPLHYGLVRGMPVFKRPEESDKDFRERLIEERRAK